MYFKHKILARKKKLKVIKNIYEEAKETLATFTKCGKRFQRNVEELRVAIEIQKKELEESSKKLLEMTEKITAAQEIENKRVEVELKCKKNVFIVGKRYKQISYEYYSVEDKEDLARENMKEGIDTLY